jgi:hypothetical protein
VQVGRTSRHLADDLRYFVEHGAPSPRKQRQLAGGSRRWAVRDKLTVGLNDPRR